MPEGVIRIAHSIDTDGMRRIVNIQKDSVPRARACGQPDRRIDRDVVTFIRAFRSLGAFAVVAAFPQPIDRSALRVGEDARAGNDLCQLRMG